MAKRYEIKKLNNGKFEIKDNEVNPKDKVIVDRGVLAETIRQLEEDKIVLEKNLAEKRELLSEVEKVGK